MRLDSAQREHLLSVINNAPAGSKIAAAKEFGIDLTLNLRSLDLTLKERLQELQSYQALAEKLSAARH